MSLLGTRIGRIRLVDRLGKGGMGEVYVGYDETLDRKVAVKCVLAGERFDDQVKGRFLQEARILSRLAHPNICQIFDFVEDGGRDFLVMELVEGRGLKQGLRDGLDDRRKLEIAQRIADVLVAAHAEGVVHRDLKPEHVMITDDGEVKVLDFGVAHSVDGAGRVVVTDETVDLSSGRPLAVPSPSPYEKGRDPSPPGRSRPGSEPVVGTPRYMSPEQARGEAVTPASDMYTFGLLLQELFTGEPPYDKQPMPALLAAVAEGRNKPAVGLGRALTDLIEGLKALKPGDRPTARETADRLRAIREAPMRRLRRAAAAAAVLLGVAGMAKYTFDLRRERSAAVAARNQAVVARDQAEDLVTFMLEDLADELRPAGKLEVLGKVARKALDYYEQVAPGTAGEPAFRRGRAFYSVAEVLDSQGDLDAALEAAQAARDLHQRQVDEDPERASWQNGLALDLLQLGDIYNQQGERELARGSLLAGRAIAARLVEVEPARLEWRRTLGEAHYGLGIFHLFREPEQARAAFEEAIAVYRDLSARVPSELLYRYRLAVLYGQGLGQVYQMQGLHQESFEAVRKAFELYQEITRADPSNSRWQHGFAWENRRLGEHLESEGRLAEAVAAYRRAREIGERLVALEPSQIDWQHGLAVDHALIGGVQERQGALGEALASLHEALRIVERLVQIEPGRDAHQHLLADLHLHVGSVQSRLGHAAEARKARERAAELLAPFSPEELDGFTLEDYALALLHLGRAAEAAPVVARLRAVGWFESSADAELVELCRRRGLGC